MTLKQKFIKEARDFKPNVLVTAVKLPTGVIEVITNHQDLKEKLEYLTNAYDDEFRLERNPDVRIIGYILA